MRFQCEELRINYFKGIFSDLKFFFNICIELKLSIKLKYFDNY